MRPATLAEAVERIQVGSPRDIATLTPRTAKVRRGEGMRILLAGPPSKGYVR
jgi:hypothetical protein